MTARDAFARLVGAAVVVTYADDLHEYRVDGQRCVSVTSAAKIVADCYLIEQSVKGKIAAGMALDANLVEEAARHIGNRQGLIRVGEAALVVAGAHLPANHGLQMHAMLEVVAGIRDPETALTQQQREDIEALARTLDRGRLTPVVSERINLHLDYLVAGRLDLITEDPRGRQRVADLKSSDGAIKFGAHSTAAQLGLYANADAMDDGTECRGDVTTVRNWRPLPEGLDRDVGLIIQVNPGEHCGRIHEINIAHGWKGAQHALEIISWRRELDYGRDICREVQWEIIDEIRGAQSMDALVEIFNRGTLTPEAEEEMRIRFEQLKVPF